MWRFLQCDDPPPLVSIGGGRCNKSIAGGCGGGGGGSTVNVIATLYCLALWITFKVINIVFVNIV